MRDRLDLVLRLHLGFLLVSSVAVAVPDLQLSMSSPNTVVAGTDVVYDVTVYNSGTTASADGTLSAVLPAGLTLISDSAGICSVVSTAADHQQTVECALPSIEQYELFSIAMNVLVEHDFLSDQRPDTVHEAVIVPGSVTGETNFDNNAASSNPLTVRGEADLAIFAFTQDDGPVPAGEQFSYVIIVDNLGPSTAENVNIVDTLVTSSYVQANGCSLAVWTEGGGIALFDCNFALSTGVFDLASMGSNWLNPRGASCDWNPGADPGEETSCSSNGTDRDAGRAIITLDLTAEQEVGLENFVTVSSDTFDPDTSNDQTTVIGSFESVADLEIQKVAGPPSAPGEMVSWTVTAINHGPSAAENVLVLDTLPGGLVDGTISITGNLVEDILGSPTTGPAVSCTRGTPGDPLDPAQCDLGGLPTGWGATLVVNGLVDPGFDASIGGTAVGLTNDVEMRSETVDAVFDVDGGCGNDPCPPGPDQPNFASATAAVGSVADIFVDLSDAPDPVISGEALSYQAVVGNHGPSVAEEVIFTLALPDGVSFLSAWSLEGRVPESCVHVLATNTVMCELFDLELGRSVHRTVVVNATVDGTVANGSILSATASATSAVTPESNPSDNVGVAETTTVGEAANVYIDFVDVPASAELDEPFEPDLAVQGEEHRFAVTFGNTGPSIARDVGLQFFLDFVSFGVLGETFVRCEPFDIDDFVACSESNGVVTVDLLLFSNQQIVPGDLSPGQEHGFYLITQVVPDYLDQHLLTGTTDPCQDFGFDEPCSTTDSRITTVTPDAATFDNVDAEDARIMDPAGLPVDSADVAVQIAVDYPTVLPGETFDYHLAVLNGGPSTADDVILTVWLPGEVELEEVILGVDPMVCDETPATGTFACDLFAIAAEETRTITARVSIDPATPAATVLRSTASVESASTEVILTNNQVTHSLMMGMIFGDGFESGDLSSWAPPAP